MKRPIPVGSIVALTRTIKTPDKTWKKGTYFKVYSRLFDGSFTLQIPDVEITGGPAALFGHLHSVEHRDLVLVGR